MWRDRYWWASVAAGGLFWAALFAITQPAVALAWPLAQPASYLLVALAYPVAEEIVFRGLLQEWLHRLWPWRRGPISPANVMTSIAFTALHFFYHPPLWAAGVFLPSLLFGHFKDKHRSLLPPIALHIYYNAGYYWLFAPPP